MGPVASPLAGSFQLAYVTRDMTAAKAMLERQYGVGGFTSIVASPIPLTIPAGATALMEVEVAWVGDWMIELIRPVSGAVDIYRQGLPDGNGVAFHHVGALVAGTREDWDRFRAALDEPRIVIEGGRERMRFVYVDERPTLGHLIEYVWMDAAVLDANPLWGRARRAS